MKILVIFTGGTIGSCLKDGYIGTDASTSYTLLKPFKNDSITFETASPYTVLSEDLSAKELNILQDEISKALKKDYDGIIVTHGTDTIQYTACALQNAFGNSNIPILLVSAAYPLDDKRTNGFDNFACALEFIKQKTENGVFVAYKNEKDSNTCVHLPSQLLLHNESLSDLKSLYSPFAVFDGKEFRNIRKITKKPDSCKTVSYCEFPEILVIESRPADSFNYSLDNVKAVIIKPYHSVTLNTSSKKLVDFCKAAKEKGIPVFTYGGHRDENYESTSLFDPLGIKLLECETFASAFMTLWARISE